MHATKIMSGSAVKFQLKNGATCIYQRVPSDIWHGSLSKGNLDRSHSRRWLNSAKNPSMKNHLKLSFSAEFTRYLLSWEWRNIFSPSFSTCLLKNSGMPSMMIQHQSSSISSLQHRVTSCLQSPNGKTLHLQIKISCGVLGIMILSHTALTILKCM